MNEMQREAYELEIRMLKEKLRLTEIEKSILINQLSRQDPYIIQVPDYFHPWTGTNPYHITCSAN